ncbi:MAG: NUDIX domain-containing protein [Acidimicrobiia bacterium]|nr:NUDIX domain-containing protein [Acidimicrobiia bacterium]
MVESAGILVYRSSPLEVLIAHPGGPLWTKRNEGSWSIPKGLIEAGESRIEAARREFVEETGLTLDLDDHSIPLGSIKLKSGKVVFAWAVEADLDVDDASFGTFEMQWPPKSGRLQSFPEIDQLRWVTPETATELLNPAQVALVDRLVAALQR